MDKILTLTFRHSFLHLYCRLNYQFGSKGSFIKSNAITLNYNLSIVYKQIKIKEINFYRIVFYHMFYIKSMLTFIECLFSIETKMRTLYRIEY